MRTRLLLFLVLLLSVSPLWSQSSSPKTLTEAEARKLATDFANREVKDKVYEFRDGHKGHYPKVETTEEWFYVVIKEGRWHLYDGARLSGWHVEVSFKPDGSDPKLEHFAFDFSPE